jgi:hypothetical protein
MKIRVDNEKLVAHRAKEERRARCLALQSQLSELVGSVLYKENGERTDVPLDLITVELHVSEVALLREFDVITYGDSKIKIYGDSPILVTFTTVRDDDGK